MNTTTKKLFLTAAVAGILGGLSAESAFAKKPAAKAKTAVEVKGSCTEPNTCKGNGGCGGTAAGAKHACKGQNACSGNVVENTTEAKCTELKGTFKAN